MDTVFTRAIEEEGGVFLVEWRWLPHNAVHPTAGSLRFAVDACHQAERAALAELRALYHILEQMQVHGPSSRLGNGVRFCVSHRSIPDALSKRALKRTKVGKTDKAAIANAASFLATKYFEAVIEVRRCPEVEPKKVLPRVDLAPLGAEFDRIAIECPVLGEPVSVSRHAIHRYVARIDQGRGKLDEDDLGDVADARWSAAWRWFVRILPNPNLVRAELLPKVKEKYERTFGKDCYYLHFRDAGVLLPVQRDAKGLIVTTVIRLSPYAPLIEMPGYAVGQTIVKAHHHLSRG
ncbi:hypothetical protein [Paracidovorax citrulli]|uniref:hypothetical protein n=1 Tax=Paracidovorax citrulli TaxID=80869 RepID=UPI003FA7A498